MPERLTDEAVVRFVLEALHRGAQVPSEQRRWQRLQVNAKRSSGLQRLLKGGVSIVRRGARAIAARILPKNGTR